MRTAVPPLGQTNPLSSASSVFFHKALQFLILAAGAAHPLRFTWLPMVFTSPAWTAPRPLSRYVKLGCRIRNGLTAICDLWPLVGDFKGYWLGTASSISSTKSSERCLRYLPCTLRQPPFCSKLRRGYAGDIACELNDGSDPRFMQQAAFRKGSFGSRQLNPIRP
jgi:hypothetical protein